MGQSIENVSRTVLVVEDEAIIRMSAMDLVEEHGFAALGAGSADEAIVILESHPDIRIIFTDIQMAGSMDGLQLAAYAHDRWPPLKFIIVSGEQTPDVSMMPDGARFFAKPYDISAIGRGLNDLLS